MNRDETKAAIEVMQHWLDGGAVEWRRKTKDERNWASIDMSEPDRGFNWLHNEYRKKPEPREFFVLVGTNGNPVGVATTENKIQSLYDVVHVREVL